jgi:glycosyltransferase involved in cell wall biosynthesis
MKICQLCAVDFTLYHFLLPLMEAERAAGHEVIGVCADGPWAEKVRARGFRSVPLGIARSYNLWRHGRSFGRLVRLMRAERFDMVHVHTPIAALLGRLAARCARVPCIVYTAHGFYFHEGMAPWKRFLFIALEWFAGRCTDVLFTQAEEDAAMARRLGLCKGGVIEAIGNGVDPARFHPSNDAGVERALLRAALATPIDATVVLMVGRLVAEKGYPELFEAMEGLGAVLWAVGERLPSDHEGAVKAPTEAHNIRLLGQRSDIDALMRAADLFVLPSHREGMPRSIIEAMMSGLAVVATDVRGSREEVIKGETGLLVPIKAPDALHAALARLLDDAVLRVRMGVAGRARALALYDEALVIQRQLTRLGLVREPLSPSGSGAAPI